ncbi:AAA family ATPase [Mediterraneibacter glycyrrhizinilyticus]|uniref:AAA family ATPase n=1 Tax=Mediterraneibacter glycyrrhizinilyticus TaxID=342942 RepID=UPI0025AA437B|nr:hypothetical protein [Mediterraneibacter glycyrrhizinilyticus]MDN0043803.1 hypothetical protein [Mediterraneibacter glycyrrhizinilyticus]
MGEFYITKVTAKGSGKQDSSVDLRPGLNIIQGRSNTGKTCIIKCIDFCFGSKTKPFDDSFGYDTIDLSIHTGKGNITISRVLGKNQVEVTTDVPGFDSGTYDLRPSKKKEPLPILSDLLLSSIGIEGEHHIVSNKDFNKRRLTWRTFLHILLFHVSEIAKETSVIEPEQGTEKTPFLSSLLFLLSGRDFAESDAKTKKEIRVARKRAVEEYVNKKIQSAADKKKDLQKNLDAFNGVDVEQAMQDVIDSLQNTETQISEAVDQSRELLSQILRLQSRAAECDLLQTRYASLKTQYVSDIKRLSFIVNGEVEIGHVPQNQICPFCDGKLPARSKKTYIESAQAELDRIMLQMNGLEETENDLNQEKQEIDENLKSLQAKRDSIETMIEKELQPQADALRQSLNGYRAYIQIKQELQVIDDFASSWETDLRELPSEDESHIEYHPKEYFDDTFQERIDTMLKEALTECAYENLTTARFNMKDFDIEVNGHKKADVNGQGYCSFLNSVVAIVFRSYMEKYATYNPGFVILDTPLLGLDQGIADTAPESMRTALFNFFINHQNDGQIIILENIRHIPKLEYEKAGANVITFTKGLEPGRYGFLLDVQ